MIDTSWVESVFNENIFALITPPAIFLFIKLPIIIIILLNVFFDKNELKEPLPLGSLIFLISAFYFEIRLSFFFF